MASLITIHAHIPNLQHPCSHLKYPLTPSPILLHNTEKRPKIYIKSSTFGGSIGFKGLKFESSSCCRCKQSEGDVELEAEIMEFMEKSEKPTMFPSKRDLVKAGRMELVEAIQRRGGWYSFGWDDENVGDKDDLEEAMDYDIGEFQRRVESCKYIASSREYYDNSIFDHGSGFSSPGDSDSSNSNSSSSLGRPLELGDDTDAGIEGILSRLEKQRNSDFGINLGKYGYETFVTSKHDEYDRGFDTSTEIEARIDVGEISPNIEPKNWKTWSHERAGFQHTEFEAAEISFSKVQLGSDNESYSVDKKTVNNEEHAEARGGTKEIDHNQIRSHIQHLEFELSTALNSSRSKREQSISDETTGSFSELHKISDEWEFQENDFISAQERLRSIRAKLAVVEGKMALTIIEAQKAVEEKQKRINGARKALQLLHTTCVVWPNSASEVLLVGSFDGWTTQRKMEKSRSGIFSVYLKLYPGRYEIKFIVDGIWKVDPLRPIVKSSGYENNLLIVT